MKPNNKKFTSKKKSNSSLAEDPEDMKDFRSTSKNNRGAKRRQGSSRKGATMTNSYTKDDFAPPTAADNDPSWYVFNDRIALDNGNLNTYSKVGSSIASGRFANGQPYDTFVPSLMALRFIPTIGENDPTFSSEAAVNIQGLAMWKAIQSRVQKEIPFAHSDITLFLMAMDSVYMLYTYAQRLYMLSSGLNVDNISVPNVYYRAMSMSATVSGDNTSGWEDYRKALNIIAARINDVKVPAEVKIIQRHVWLCRNVFKDSESYKASQYIFVPEGYYELKDPDDDHVDAWCQLHYREMPTTLDGMLKLLNALVTSIQTNKLYNTVQSWLMRAYSYWYTVALTEPGDTLIPAFSVEVLPQIHNARICGSLDTSDAISPLFKGHITQDEHDCVSQEFALQPRISFNNNTRNAWGHLNWNYWHFLDLLKDINTVGDNYVCTRFVVTGAPKTVQPQGVSPTIERFVPRWYGTEILTRAEVYSGGVDGTVYVDSWDSNGYSINFTGNMSWNDWLPVMRYLHFEMGPMLLTTTDKDASIPGSYEPDPNEVDVIGNITNFCTVTNVEIRQLHSSAVMGEWLSKEDFAATV